MSRVFTTFSEAANLARILAILLGQPVEVRRLPEGWDVPRYSSWAGELEEPDFDFARPEERVATGLAPPDWEVSSSPLADTWDWDPEDDGL